MEPHLTGADPQPVVIRVDPGGPVSGLLVRAEVSRACCVLAHGAGAGMRHPFLSQTAEGLWERRISSLRYQFPYMERGSKRSDPPSVAHAAVRAAVAEVPRLLPESALFAGGKSFGGRMTSQAQSESPLPGVRGLVFLGFPLHPPGQPGTERGKHLFHIQVPMLFLQGDRDEFANLDLLQSVTQELGARATLRLFPGANHSFHVSARTGRRDSEIQAELLDAIRDWIEKVLGICAPSCTNPLVRS